MAPSIDFPTSAKLQMDILALALACDLTRVASLQFSTALSQITHTWLGSNQTQIHHSYSHEGPTYLGALAPCAGYNNMGKCSSIGDIYSPNNLNMYQDAAQQQAIDLWYATQIAYLAQKLNTFTGVGGGMLLDQSVICTGSELDMGAAHNHDDTPFVLIGGANGRLKTGQMVTFASQVPNNQLLTSIAHAMGLQVAGFGNATYTGDLDSSLT